MHVPIRPPAAGRSLTSSSHCENLCSDAYREARRSGPILGTASGFKSESRVLVRCYEESKLENTGGHENGVSQR